MKFSFFQSYEMKNRFLILSVKLIHINRKNFILLQAWMQILKSTPFNKIVFNLLDINIRAVWFIVKLLEMPNLIYLICFPVV